MSKHQQQSQAKHSTRAKVLATVVAVGATGAVAGLGTYGAWTSTTTADAATYTAGSVTLVKVNDATAPLTFGMSNMAPGDTAQRAVTLTNSGTLGFSSLTMGVAATTSSELDTDTTDGLKVNADKCTETATGAALAWVWNATNSTFTCAGTVTSILSSAAAVGTHTLTPVAASAVNGVDQVRVTVTLPTTAPTTMQGDSSTLSVTFTGTSRTGAPQAS